MIKVKNKYLVAIRLRILQLSLLQPTPLSWSDKLGHKDSLIMQTIRRSVNDTSKN